MPLLAHHGTTGIQQLPSHLEGVPRVMLGGDVSQRLRLSMKGVHALVSRGVLIPCGQAPKIRRGKVEYFLVFDPEEVERVALSREVPEMTPKRERRRDPNQLRLQLFVRVKGGRR